MAQTTHRPPAAQHPPGHQDARQAAPAPAPRMPALPPMVSDRQLLEQLRQIYQVANRHLPVPKTTELSKSLTDTLDEIAEVAEKAVEGYKP